MKRKHIWQASVGVVLVVLVSVGIVGYARWKEDQPKWHADRMRRLALMPKPVVKSATAPTPSKDPDSHVVLKSQNPQTLADEKKLKGSTLWASDGGQLDYYDFNGHAADLTHKAGTLLGAEPIKVVDAIDQVAPSGAQTRIDPADGLLLLVFTLPDDSRGGSHSFALPVGNRQGKDYTILTDQLFFYDDPHQLYAYWGPQVWQSIDKHQATLGMTENQVRMALGNQSTPRGDIMGDRDVEFTSGGHPKLVTFVNGKATRITDL